MTDLAAALGALEAHYRAHESSRRRWEQIAAVIEVAKAADKADRHWGMPRARTPWREVSLALAALREQLSHEQEKR